MKEKIYDKIISMKLDSETYLKLREIARKKKRTVSEIIRELIYEYVKKELK